MLFRVVGLIASVPRDSVEVAMPISAPVFAGSTGQAPDRESFHPLHLFLLGGAGYFLVSGFLSDWAYFTSLEIQWKNFASWLILGGLVFGGFALLWALIGMIGADRHRGRRVIYFLLLLTAWILGFMNELIHAKDAWASMPEALVLSGLAGVLALAATGLGFSTVRPERR